MINYDHFKNRRFNARIFTCDSKRFPNRMLYDISVDSFKDGSVNGVSAVVYDDDDISVIPFSCPPSILMYSIEKKDSYGKLIYEGDIIRVSYDNCSYFVYCIFDHKVEFFDIHTGNRCFVGGFDYYEKYKDDFELFVIGNIFESQDMLLEEKKCFQ